MPFDNLIPAQGKDRLSAQNKERLSSVVSGTVKTKKKSALERAAQTFLVPDLNTIGTYLLTSVLVPVLRRTLRDLIVGTTDTMLSDRTTIGTSAVPRVSIFGNTRQSSLGSDLRIGSYNPPSQRTRVLFDDILYPSYEDAKKVLDDLRATLEMTGVATVLDLYDLSGLGDRTTPNMQGYGWISLNSVEIIEYADPSGKRWILKLPNPFPIDISRLHR